MMKPCTVCGSYVRHWRDEEGMIHFQCIGCGKKWNEEQKNERHMPND